MANPLISINKKTAYYFALFLVLYQFSNYIANDMIMPAMINVVEYFNAPESAIEASLTAFLLGGASLQLFLGPLSDNIGRRPIMLAGCFIFLISTTLIPLSHNITEFLLARYCEGMGLCFIGVVGYAALQEIFEEMDAVRVASVLASIASLAPLLGPLIGAIMIHFFKWQRIFFLIALLGLAALIGLWRYMPETIGKMRTDGVIIQKTPIHFKAVFKNYMKLLANRPFLYGCISIGFMGVPMIIWIAISPIILITAAKLSVLEYALWQIPIIGASILGNCILRYLSYKKTLTELSAFGTIFIIIGPLLGLFLFLFAGNHYYWIIVMMVSYAFGCGMANAPLYRQILFLIDHHKGTASALISLAIMILNGIAVQLMTVVYASHQNIKVVFTAIIAMILYLIYFYLMQTKLNPEVKSNLKLKGWFSLKNLKFRKMFRKGFKIGRK